MRWLLILCTFTCCLLGSAQVIENPVFDRTIHSSFHIDKIERTKDSTYVYVTYSAEAGSWANISHNTILRDTETGRVFPIYRSSGIPFGPQKRTFAFDERCELLFCFPTIKSSRRIDFIEDENEKAFNVYGIDMEQGYEAIYRESELSRYSNMASFYDAVDDTIKAIQYKEREKDVTEYIYGIKSEQLLVCMLNLSIMYDKYGLYKKAIDMMEKLTVLHAGIWGKSDRNYALQLRTLAQFYSHAKKYNLAINKYKEAITLFESLGIIDNEYALALRFISEDYYNIGDFSNSFSYQERAIQARKHIKDADSFINELYNTLLIVHGGKEDITKRIGLVDKVLLDCSDLIDSTSLAFAGLYRQMASSYSLIDDNKNAIEYCDKAIAIMDGNRYNDNEDYAELLRLKCKYQQRCGLKDEAIASGTAAKQLYESLNIKSLKYAELLGDLAWAYGLSLNYEKSVQLQSQAAGIFEKANDWISLAEVYGSISHYYQSAEKLVNAEQNIKKAIDVLNEHDNAEQYIIDAVEQTGNGMMNNPFALASIKQWIDTNKSNYLQTLARIYQKQDNYTKAINTELESGKILKNMGDSQMYALHLINLSEYYMRNHQLDDAIACTEQSLQLLSNDKRYSQAFPRLQMAMIQFQKGNISKAIQDAEESVSSFKSINDHDGWISANYLLSTFLWKNHDYNKAEQCLSEELDYLRNFISNELTGMTAEQKQRLWDKYEHYFLLYRNIVEKTDRNTVLLSKLYDYILFSKSLLLDTDILQDANSISRLNVKWHDIQRHLSNNAIAVEFISTMEDEENYHTYHALVIDKESPSPKMITLYSESRLEEIKKTEARNIRDIVGELIWKPILAQYATVRDIYFSPDGILYMLPIEYYSADGSINMSERYNMFRISSTKELVIKYESHDRKQAALYGGLDYSPFTIKSAENNTLKHNGNLRSISERGGFEPLYNTLKEINEIQALMKTNNISTAVFSGNKGTETSFKDLSHREVNMIHLATHGMYVAPSNVKVKKQSDNFQFLELLSNDKNPVKEDIELTHSFLVMSGGNRLAQRDSSQYGIEDGILTAKEISQLDLEGLDLVVLSACETALGDVENGGVYGLQRGFKKAGANTILMSLDKVDDEATRILMVEFYRNLMNGKTKHQSLKDAQKHLREVENGKYNAPKYWASFIMLDGLN